MEVSTNLESNIEGGAICDEMNQTKAFYTQFVSQIIQAIKLKLSILFHLAASQLDYYESNTFFPVFLMICFRGENWLSKTKGPM